MADCLFQPLFQKSSWVVSEDVSGNADVSVIEFSDLKFSKAHFLYFVFSENAKKIENRETENRTRQLMTFQQFTEEGLELVGMSSDRLVKQLGVAIQRNVRVHFDVSHLYSSWRTRTPSVVCWIDGDINHTP